MLWEYSILLLRIRISCRTAAPSAKYKLLRKKRYTPCSMHLGSKFTVMLGLIIGCRNKVVYINNKQYLNVKLKLTQFVHFGRKFTYLFHQKPSNLEENLPISSTKNLQIWKKMYLSLPPRTIKSGRKCTYLFHQEPSNLEENLPISSTKNLQIWKNMYLPLP